MAFAAIRPVDTSIEARRIRMRAAIDALYEAKTSAGYPHDFGGGHGVKVLQTRESDLPYWLALAQTASIQIGLGNGGEPHGAIRTADNTHIPVTASQALAAMLGMQSYLGQFLAASWAIKDEVAAAEDDAALDAIDINDGWPGASA